MLFLLVPRLVFVRAIHVMLDGQCGEEVPLLLDDIVTLFLRWAYIIIILIDDDETS